MNNMTREEYLNQAGVELTKLFNAQGYEVPTFNVSCSWPGGGSSLKRIGECWPKSASDAGVNEVFISPLIADSIRALDILAHEMIHVVDDCTHGHRKEFSRIMKAIGLEGKPTATHAGERLHAEIEGIVSRLGEYPHEKLELNSPKKQQSRQLKAECTCCGAVWRMSAKWLEQVTACPVCRNNSVEIG